MHLRYNKIQHLYIIAVCFSLIHCVDKLKENMNLLGSKSIPFDLPPHIKKLLHLDNEPISLMMESEFYSLRRILY